MKLIKILFLLISFQMHNLLAQSQIKNLNPEEYYDFWIGNWDLTWETSSGIGIGENIITKILDKNVIEENFKGLSDSNMIGFPGRSWSEFNKNNGTWYNKL